MTAPQPEPFLRPLADDPATTQERQLVQDAIGVDLDRLGPMGRRDTLRLLRAGYAEGRRHVLDASPRVYRVGDPEPEHRVVLIDEHEQVGAWHPGDPDWLDYLRCYGPVVEVPAVDYAAVVEADLRRRMTPDASAQTGEWQVRLEAGRRWCVRDSVGCQVGAFVREGDARAFAEMAGPKARAES